MKRQILKKFTWGGILWTLVTGTLSHFFYQWSGENFLIGLVSPVNETVWEHLKLLFFPGLIFLLAEKIVLEDRYPDIFCQSLRGLWAGMISMPLLFYGYTFFTKEDYLWADIAIFFISVLLAFLLPYARLIGGKTAGQCGLRQNLLILFALLFLFFFLSVSFMRG